ncbi:unnamed protein product [Gemmata massiliana]|uniref:Uncharacterized protein n=1 Tax=Gemmata massiliana TaxID=1210884 RepID=A0A6P2D2B9_9BACT|nr:hypothetical protein [Gemmata massiliana]VTR93582.1 unnamed protein product [Gemmata massiliana]
MPATVPGSASRSKPRCAPAPAPDLNYSLALWRALAESNFNTDANVIAKAAKDLLRMIEQFQEDHSPGSLTRELSHAEVYAPADNYATTLARHVLSDLAGLAWCLESAVAFITSELLEEPPAELKGGTRRG